MSTDPFADTRPERPSTSNFEKYQTRNPLVRHLIRRFLQRIVDIVEEIRPGRIVDIGCGEGLLARELRRLPFEVDYRGFDINPLACSAASRLNPDREFLQADLFDLELADGEADLVVCLELLEHLLEPERALDRIARWTGRSALLSVPWEPFFRGGSLLRGKYLFTFGNHPEHVQQFRPRSFRRTVERSFGDVRMETCFPWLLAVASH